LIFYSTIYSFFCWKEIINSAPIIIYVLYLRNINLLFVFAGTLVEANTSGKFEILKQLDQIPVLHQNQFAERQGLSREFREYVLFH